MAASANCRLVARLPRTAFKKGESGNPRGRSPGTRNKTTVEVREMASRLIDKTRIPPAPARTVSHRRGGRGRDHAVALRIRQAARPDRDRVATSRPAVRRGVETAPGAHARALPLTPAFLSYDARRDARRRSGAAALSS
jgi:hypothetical protein